jgi:hypothetical protein
LPHPIVSFSLVIPYLHTTPSRATNSTLPVRENGSSHAIPRRTYCQNSGACLDAPGSNSYLPNLRNHLSASGRLIRAAPEFAQSTIDLSAISISSFFCYLPLRIFRLLYVYSYDTVARGVIHPIRGSYMARVASSRSCSPKPQSRSLQSPVSNPSTPSLSTPLQRLRKCLL